MTTPVPTPNPTPAQVLTAAQIEALVCLAAGQETLITADEFMPLIPLGLIQPKVDPVDLRMSYTLTQAGAVIAALLAAHAEALAREQEALNVLEGLLDEVWDGQRAYVPDSSTCAAAYEAFKRLAAAREDRTPAPPPAQAPASAGGEG